MVKKKMRVQIFILRDSPAPSQGLVAEHDLDPVINRAKRIFLDKFRVEIKPYGTPIVQTLMDVAPPEAVDVGCDRESSGLITTSFGAFGDEFGSPGDYFAGKLAGWVVVPISLRFPVTVFVVRSIRNKIGCRCSIPIADYVTLSATPGTAGSTLTGVKGPDHAGS